jgi:two-component sensor histidine kinase
LAWQAWLPDKAVRPWQAIGLGLALAAVATLVRFALWLPLGRELPFITFVPAVIVAAALGRFAGGLSCLAGATLGAALVLMPLGASAPLMIGSFWIVGGLVIAVVSTLADTVRELRVNRAKQTESEAQLQTLVGELAHRNRNALFVIMNLVSQSARSATSAADAERIINDRLQALLRAQEVVADGTSAGLSALVERALEPFGRERIEISPSPDMQVASNVAVGLGLLLYELATNAVKYGALSAEAGRILIAWTVEDGAAQLVWREVDGPRVSEPTKRGFGARLIAAVLVPQGGKAVRRFEPQGVTCEMLIPGLPAAAATRPLVVAGPVFSREILGGPVESEAGED